MLTVVNAPSVGCRNHLRTDNGGEMSAMAASTAMLLISIGLTICNQQVAGSSPVGGSIIFKHLRVASWLPVHSINRNDN